MCELTPDAAARLCRLNEEAEWRERGPKRALDASQIRSLYDHLHTVEDYRDVRGRRYQLATVLSLAVAAPTGRVSRRCAAGRVCAKPVHDRRLTP